jgi:uncharacterized repeat protein (TIGR03803 family)
MNRKSRAWPHFIVSKLVRANIGCLATLMLAFALVGPVQAQTDPTQLTVIHAFTGADGKGPVASLILASDGNLYGTTTYGGTDNLGTVFRVTPAGIFSIVYSFDGSVGAYPLVNLIQGTDGSLYGTTANGGASNAGAIFKMTLAGVATNMYSFSEPDNNEINADGFGPHGALLQGSDGNFYGTTFGGIYGGGTLFKITAAGVLTTLHSFGAVDSLGNKPDGFNPTAGLTLGSSGNLYGSTFYGGVNQPASSGCSLGGTVEGTPAVGGTIFSMDPAGSVSTLYSFGALGSMDGSAPTNLTMMGDGNLYGVAECGGNHGAGVFYMITPAGVLTNIYAFVGDTTDSGNGPIGTLLATTDGTGFYGVAQFGGGGNSGVVYRITTAGALTVLYSFSATNTSNANQDGAVPAAGLTRDATGNLYGTTQYGGPAGAGTIFRLSVPTQAGPPPAPANTGGSGGGAVSWQILLLLLVAVSFQIRRARPRPRVARR